MTPTDALTALEKYQASFKAQMATLLAGLQAGALSYAVWQGRVENEVRALHLFAAQLAVGGVAQLTPADRDRLALLVDRQLAYFTAFAAQEMPPSAQQIRLARLNLYAGAARATYFGFYALSQGITFALPAVPGDGSSPCGNHDHCQIIIHKRTGEGAWDIFWQIDSAVENCVVCQRRAIVWNPLQVRGYVIQPYDATGMFA